MRDCLSRRSCFSCFAYHYSFASYPVSQRAGRIEHIPCQDGTEQEKRKTFQMNERRTTFLKTIVYILN